MVYIRSFWQEITIYTVIYDVYIRSWSTPKHDGTLEVKICQPQQSRVQSHVHLNNTAWSLTLQVTFEGQKLLLSRHAKWLGLTRTAYINRIWLYIWWVPYQKYRTCIVFIYGSGQPSKWPPHVNGQKTSHKYIRRRWRSLKVTVDCSHTST